MCGIVGFNGFRDEKLLNEMLREIIHRGKDEKILSYQDGLNFGMNRLSINNLKMGIYPLRYKNYLLIYNGEIYNYKKLGLFLHKKHIIFNEETDGSVILPLYDLYGYKAFTMLDGMFAVCIFDVTKKTVILARDKMGEKPLYYSNQNNQFYFASELKAILKVIKKELYIEKSAFSSYLTQGFTNREKTLVKGIKKLPPGSYLKYNFKSNELQVKPYWKLVVKEGNYKNYDQEDLIRKLLDMVEESVKERLIGDVKTGCFLSGGVDSSLITYFAAKNKKDLTSFSISFPEDEKVDETRYAQEAAKICGTRHRTIECTSKKVQEILENIAEYVDEPFVDLAVLPTFLLAQEARKHVKVALTGEGADELFGGYERYRKELIINIARQGLKFLNIDTNESKKIFFGRYKKLIMPPESYYLSQEIWKNDLKTQLVGDLKLSNREVSRNFYKNSLLTAMQKTDLEGFLSEQLLMKTDKMTMASNLEVRAPYLDPKIVNFALSLPNNYKIRKGQGKYLLKLSAEKIFSKKFVWRPKHGFDVPLGKWFKNDLKDVVVESLQKSFQYKNLFSPDYYKKIVDEHMIEKADHTYRIWSMILLIKWLERYEINNYE